MGATECTPAHALLSALFGMYQHIVDTHACAVRDIRHALTRPDTVCAVFEVLNVKMSDVDALMQTLLELMHTARQTQEDGMQRAVEELASARVSHWVQEAEGPLPTIYEAKQELERASRLVHETQGAYTKSCSTINAMTNEIWREFYDELLCTARDALSTGSLAQGSTLQRACVLWEGLLECYNGALWHVEVALEARATHRAYMMLLHYVVLPSHAHAHDAPEKHDEASKVGEAADLGTASENDEAGSVLAVRDHVLCVFRRWLVAAVGTKYSRRIARQRAASCLRAWRDVSAQAAQCRLARVSTAWHNAQALYTMAHDRRMTCCAGAVRVWKQRTARARRARQYLHKRALVRSSRVLLCALVVWKNDKAATQRVHAWLGRVAPQRAAQALLRAWQRWKHRIIAASNLHAKYRAFARQLLLAANDTAFFTRAAWRGRFRERRAKVATFAKLVRQQRLQPAFDVMAHPVELRKDMNELCRRRHSRYSRVGFDVLFKLVSVKQCRLLQFEMQALDDIAEARRACKIASTLACIQPEKPVPPAPERACKIASTLACIQPEKPVPPAPERACKIASTLLCMQQPPPPRAPCDVPATPEVTAHGLGISPQEVVSLAIDFVLEASGGGQGGGALGQQPLALHAVRKVVQRIQNEHGGNFFRVQGHELFWWAAITDLTVASENNGVEVTVLEIQRRCLLLVARDVAWHARSPLEQFGRLQHSCRENFQCIMQRIWAPAVRMLCAAHMHREPFGADLIGEQLLDVCLLVLSQTIRMADSMPQAHMCAEMQQLQQELKLLAQLTYQRHELDCVL